MPSLAGAITSTWWNTIFLTYQRILPYQAMASESIYRIRDVRRARRVNNKALNRFTFGFRHYRFHALCSITRLIISLLMDPGKAALLQIRRTDEHWTVVPSLRLAYLSLLVYAMALFSIIITVIHLNQKPSGLK